MCQSDLQRFTPEEKADEIFAEDYRHHCEVEMERNDKEGRQFLWEKFFYSVIFELNESNHAKEIFLSWNPYCRGLPNLKIEKSLL